MNSTLKRQAKGPEHLVELQRVKGTAYAKGCYRVAVLKFRSIKVGIVEKSVLFEVDSFEYINRRVDAETIFMFAMRKVS